MATRRDFYVYLLFREDGITPFYVGKGTGRRVLSHSCLSENLRGKGHIKEAIARKVITKIGHVPFEILYDGLTEAEAFDLERQLIAKHGRIIDGSGILANMTVGGEGASGVRQSQQSRQKKSLSHMKPETRRQKSQRLRETFAKPEVKKKLSEAQKRIRKDPIVAEKLEQIRRESLTRPEARQKRAENVAKALRRPEVKAKVSSSRKAMWSDPDFRKSMSEMHKRRLALKKAATTLVMFGLVTF